MNKSKPEIISKKHYVAIVNSDLTEGRGFSRYIAFSSNRSTVKRLGSRQNVQGSDADISEIELIKYNGLTYGPVTLSRPSSADEVEEEKRLKRIAAIEKAKELGLTEEELQALSMP